MQQQGGMKMMKVVVVERTVRGRGDDCVKVQICIEDSENLIHTHVLVYQRRY
jgi:hypothetical protein